MSINWDNIRYLFQIPITWFKTISKRVFGAYGTNFIIVKEGDDGGTQIDVDEDAFKQAVQEAESSHDDCVKTVNDTPPDTNGNVNVGTVKTVNNQSPDNNGNVNVVANVNLKAYGQTLLPDQQGNINLPPYVLTVNGLNPDMSTGNLVLNVDGKVKTVNSIPPDGNGDVFIGDLVYSVNSELPDQNGNVEIDIASAVEEAIQQGEIDVGTVKSVNGYTPDSHGDVVVADAVYSVNGITPDSTGDVDLGVIIASVDGHQPDTLGAVDFGLTGNKWVKTDANGHLTVSQSDPISPDSQQTGYLYNTNGTLSYKDENYVTTDTVQTIVESKIFECPQHFTAGAGSVLKTSITGPVVTINGTDQSLPTAIFTNGQSTGYISKQSTSMTVHSNNILWLEGDTTVNVVGPSGINLNAHGANKATLSDSPDDNATNLSIATVGWVKGKLNGYTGNCQVLYDVEWTGTVLRKRFATWKMKNGMLEEAPTVGSWQTIDTPVVYP